MSYKQTNIFDFLIDTFISNINNIQDTRRQRSDNKYSLKDIILSAFSIFYFQSKSWLSFFICPWVQTKMSTSRGSSNAQTMFGIQSLELIKLYTLQIKRVERLKKHQQHHLQLQILKMMQNSFMIWD